MYVRDPLDRTDAGPFRQCADDRDLLVGAEYVCHVVIVIRKGGKSQAFLCYSFYMVPWKVLAIVLWTWAPFCWYPLWGQAPGVGVQPGSDKKQQTKLGATQPQADQRGTQNAPLVVDILSHPKSEPEAAKEKAENDRKHNVDTWTISLTFAVALFTGFLAYIGWRGVKAANRTLRVIERQADLMQASLAQWVYPHNWQVAYRGPSTDGHTLLVTFQLTNGSNYPLTAGGHIHFHGKWPGAPTVIFHNFPLLPRRPRPAQANVPISNEEYAKYSDYTKGALTISVHGQITHVGAAKQQGPLLQIDGNLTCGLGRPTQMEMEAISWVARVDPVPKTGLLYYLRLYWESRKRKGGDQGQDEAN